ncbi:CRAL-TRIO domain-containing protein [Neolecta irregularis DAH-3]|uniref:CRAL-TRIO domain-containing protein n=1 Tax=Neolecta irregularis (strain DAH-3) TaxID=1198029 RepID=A0A1U7LKA4_NEOID|nr:CRAL-TRIO domain-containing protein [Neolecta irregularis DAH-3]|eukprot:OLL23023.1 CRAL-TRIO domain-containing protein [Neolecta irregularis DAH-3]
MFSDLRCLHPAPTSPLPSLPNFSSSLVPRKTSLGSMTQEVRSKNIYLHQEIAPVSFTVSSSTLSETNRSFLSIADDEDSGEELNEETDVNFNPRLHSSPQSSLVQSEDPAFARNLIDLTDTVRPTCSDLPITLVSSEESSNKDVLPNIPEAESDLILPVGSPEIPPAEFPPAPQNLPLHRLKGNTPNLNRIPSMISVAESELSPSIDPPVITVVPFPIPITGLNRSSHPNWPGRPRIIHFGQSGASESFDEESAHTDAMKQTIPSDNSFSLRTSSKPCSNSISSSVTMPPTSPSNAMSSQTQTRVDPCIPKEWDKPPRKSSLSQNLRSVASESTFKPAGKPHGQVVSPLSSPRLNRLNVEARFFENQENYSTSTSKSSMDSPVSESITASSPSHESIAMVSKLSFESSLSTPSIEPGDLLWNASPVASRNQPRRLASQEFRLSKLTVSKETKVENPKIKFWRRKKHTAEFPPMPSVAELNTHPPRPPSPFESTPFSTNTSVPVESGTQSSRSNPPSESTDINKPILLPSQSNYDPPYSNTNALKEVINHFKFVQLSPEEMLWLTKETISRYLIKNEGIIKDTLDSLHFTLTYRKQEQLAILREKKFESMCSAGSIFIHGFDKLHRLILYIYVIKLFSIKDRFCLLIWYLERLCELSARNFCVIVDYRECNGTKETSNLNDSKEFIANLCAHFPERLGALFVFQAPFKVRAFFKVVATGMSQLTRRKIHTSNSSLLEFIDSTMLLSSFGGSNTFEYSHSRYWSEFIRVISSRRRRRLTGWERLGRGIGISDVDCIEFGIDRARLDDDENSQPSAPTSLL